MPNKLFEVTQSTHNFSVKKISPRGKVIIDNFARKFVQRGMIRNPNGTYHMTPVRVFAAARKDREEYRFHINQMPEFMVHLADNYITDNLYRIVTLEVPPAVPITLFVKPKWVSREDQIPVIDYLVEKTDCRAKFVDADMGSGKTFMTLQAIALLRLRTVILIKPRYIDKWHEDLIKTYDIDLKDIMIVKGGDHLRGLIALALENKLKSSFIIISNKTFQIWLNKYEEFGNDTEALGYDITPDVFFKTVGAGIRLIDEVHQDNHLNFKIDLYTNIERTISLSGTLINNDPFMTKMYKIMHPLNTRYVKSRDDAYVSVFAVNYTFRLPDMIRTTERGSTTYSHTAFEASIKRDHTVFGKYLSLIDYTIAYGFMECKRKRKKLLIFVSTVDMATAVVKHLTRKHPTLDVQRYTTEDDYADLIESDICVSTLGSAGTAVDLPDLTTVIMTVAVASIQANLQAIGRLRKLNDNHEVQFYYFCAMDIAKHAQYSREKEEMFSGKAKTFKQLYTNFIL